MADSWLRSGKRRRDSRPEIALLGQPAVGYWVDQTLVLTRNGKAIAALVRIQDADLESFLVTESRVFKRVVRRSRASYKRGGGLTREEFEERLAKTRGA